VREEALAFPDPTLEDSFNNVYAEAHPLIAEELRWHREYEAGFAQNQAEAGQEGAR
jgi:2-oxoisovalerate dehydrogenase E1 component alpha subunit